MPARVKAGAAKAANTKKAASVAPTTNGAASKKRKAEAEESEAPAAAATAATTSKRVKREPVSARTKSVAIGKKINDVPKELLDIYVFGEGTSGELGLGSKRVNGKKPIDVKRPRLNETLKKLGVVQISCGGMHAACLCRDNKIYTWGVNDQGALGRDTNWDGGLRDMDDAEDSDSDEDDDDTGMNPLESTPGAVDDSSIAPGTKFVQVAAGDSATFALTEDGRVYGCGTFRSNDGILGFNATVKVQMRMTLIPELKNVTALAAGANHVLALDNKGNVVAWGCGQQNQLGRRIIERNKMSSLAPQGVGLPRGRIVKIACGAYHSFAIDRDGKAWGWGLNNFGEIGVPANAGEDDAVILKPVRLDWLKDHKIADIDGGVHHSVACCDKGRLFTWGRIDGHQVGLDVTNLDKDDIISDERGTPRILIKPAPHKGMFLLQPHFMLKTVQILTITDRGDIISVAAASDNSFAVARDGKAYSWGFSSNYQTGQGTIDDIETPTHIDNTAVRGKKIIAAGGGGQFSILIGKADATNGVNGH